MRIPFVKAPLTGNEKKVIGESIDSGYHGGDGPFTKKTQKLIEDTFGIGKCLLTTSCTDALEMCALLLDGEKGDEVILPSYTFSSTALAFVTHGFVPVYVDVNEANKNISLESIQEAVTDRTKAIVVVHYAGIVCDMDPIMEFAKEKNLVVIEDAAQAVNSKYKGRYAGSIGHLATFSFHATKSYSCGEGGALCINDSQYDRRAQFLWEKGTDRSLVLAGVKNKYSWVDLGSSFLISDLLASLLFDQLSHLEYLQEKRKVLFDTYTSILEKNKLNIRYVQVPEDVETNYHAFWIELPANLSREKFLEALREKEMSAYIGYVPLHTSPMGSKAGRSTGTMHNTDVAGEKLVRLPFYIMEEDELSYLAESLESVLSSDTIL